jgi:hypothetical protein
VKLRHAIAPSRHLAHRAWTDRERNVVWRGLTGRFAIAIEPLLGSAFFGFLAYGIIWRARVTHTDLWILWPVFGFVAAGFFAYLVAVLVAPFLAYMQTFKPIFIVDGYVRYRAPDRTSEYGASGYVAVLFEDRNMACEWEAYGQQTLPSVEIPAIVEFSEWGGIHKIDGRSTGLLPDEDVPVLAVGIARGRPR